jgi:hypothetical protein
MAKINEVKLCQSCGLELEFKTESCPRCGFGLKSNVRVSMVVPDYVSLQIARLVDQQIDPARTGLLSQEQIKTKLSLEQGYWFRTCGDRERKAALQDARNVLRVALHSNASADTLKDLVKLGKQIGELAAAIDAYAAKGGLLNVSTTTRPRDFEEDSIEN